MNMPGFTAEASVRLQIGGDLCNATRRWSRDA